MNGAIFCKKYKILTFTNDLKVPGATLFGIKSLKKYASHLFNRFISQR